MDLIIRNLRLTRSKGFVFTAALSDPERVMVKERSKALLYNTASLQKYAGISGNTTAAFHDRMIAAVDSQKAHESQTSSTKTLEDRNRAMKSVSIIGQSSQDTHDEITAICAGLIALQRAEVTAVFEYGRAKMPEKI